MDKPLRIMQVMAGAAQGGAETVFEDMCLAFHERGLPQKIIMRGNNPERVSRLREAGLDVETLPFGGALDIFTPWKMKKLIAAYQPDIVQTWMSRASVKTPSSKTTPKSYLKFSRLGGYYALKYFKDTDYFVTNTNDLKSYLEKEGVHGDRVQHINNFAKVREEDAPVTRDMFKTPDDAFVVLSLARYHPVKALDVLIKAVKPIPDAHLWLAGEGPSEQELRDLAKELDIEDRVHFLGWRTDQGALLNEADVCALPSRFEPFGNTFVQAWAHKTPMVCSASQGPSQYVKSGEDGLMVPVDDIDELTKAIGFIKDNPDKARAMAEAGYQRYLNEFTKDKTVDAYLAFYEDAINKLRAKTSAAA